MLGLLLARHVFGRGFSGWRRRSRFVLVFLPPRAVLHVCRTLLVWCLQWRAGCVREASVFGFEFGAFVAAFLRWLLLQLQLFCCVFRLAFPWWWFAARDQHRLAPVHGRSGVDFAFSHWFAGGSVRTGKWCSPLCNS